jgi:hypothetical protein
MLNSKRDKTYLVIWSQRVSGDVWEAASLLVEKGLVVLGGCRWEVLRQVSVYMFDLVVRPWEVE